MPRFNFARAAAKRTVHLALLLGAASAAPAAPGTPAAPPERSVQDGVLFDGVPLQGAVPAADLERYQGTSETRFLDWLSDGGMLVARRQGGQDRILRLPAAADADPAPAAVGAIGTASRVGAAASPAYRSDWLGYLREDAAGGGAALYLAPLAGGAARQLVDAASHPGAPAWAHDGKRLAFSAALRDAGQSDLYVLDTSDSAAPRLVAAGGAAGSQVLGWTGADRAVLVRRSVAGLGDELLLVDIDSGALRRVDAPAEQPPAYGRIPAARLADDGRGLYLLTDRASDHIQLRYVDLYDGSVRGLTPPLSHDVEHFDVSADGRYFAYSWTENGYGRVLVVDHSAALQYTPPDLPSGIVAGLKFDRTGARLAIELAPAVAPRDVYVYTLATQGTARWTRSDLGPLNAAQLVAPQTLRFPTWDRVAGRPRMLTALLHRAVGSGSHAVLIVIDDADAHAQLDLFTQYCVGALGLTVITPQLRRGEDGALDLGALLTWIGTQADLQRDRVLVLGRGSGGTLGLTALGLYGDRLRAAIDVDGPATSAEIAPIRRPVLLIRGLETPALDAASTEQLLWRLRNANVESWLLAPREVEGTLAGATAHSVSEQVMARFLAGQLGR